MIRRTKEVAEAIAMVIRHLHVAEGSPRILLVGTSIEDGRSAGRVRDLLTEATATGRPLERAETGTENHSHPLVSMIQTQHLVAYHPNRWIQTDISRTTTLRPAGIHLCRTRTTLNLVLRPRKCPMQPACLSHRNRLSRPSFLCRTSSHPFLAHMEIR